MRCTCLVVSLMLSIIGCGGSISQDHSFRQVNLGQNPTQPTLLRAGWWKVVTGDFRQAQTLFEKAGDHPWSRLGLGYLARLRLDQTRADIILEPLAKDSSYAGEIARSWSQVEQPSPWTVLVTAQNRALKQHAPRIRLLESGFDVLNDSNWQPHRPLNSSVNVAHALQYVHHRQFLIRAPIRCLSVKAIPGTKVYLNGEPVDAGKSHSQLIERPETSHRLDVLWVGSQAPKIRASETPCESFVLQSLRFLDPDEDWLLKTFIHREKMIIDGDLGQVRKRYLAEQSNPSSAFAIQTLVSLSKAYPTWDVLRRRLLDRPHLQPPPLLQLHLGIQAFELGNFTKSWSYLEPLSIKHADARLVLRWSIKTLLALDRDQDAQRLAQRYLQLGEPLCEDLDIVYGPLGETSTNIEQIIASDVRCNRMENAVERALRWRRLKTADTLQKHLGISQGDLILRARILAALNKTTQATTIFKTTNPVKYVDLIPTSDVTDIPTTLLHSILENLPASSTAIHLSAWLSDDTTSDSGSHVESFKDHETARVLRQDKTLRIDASGRGHLVHQERLRINHVMAARAYSEIGVPEDAHHPFIGIEKPNGLWVRPLDIEEKGTFSLPTLAVGDIIYVQYTRPINVEESAGHYTTPRLRLELPYAPVDISKITLIQPLTLNWRLSSSIESASQDTIETDSHRTTRLVQNGLGRLWQERMGAGMAFNGSFVRWHSPNMVPSFLAGQADDLLRQKRQDFPWSKTICSDGAFDATKQTALMNELSGWMKSQSTQGLTSLDYSGILSQCLDQLGVQHQVVLLAPWASQSLTQALRIDGYTHPVFILEDTRFWDAIGHQTPVDMIPHTLRKTDGLILFPWHRLGESYQTPAVATRTEQRQVRLVLKRVDGGRIMGTVTDTQYGPDAYAMRQQMLGASNARLTQYVRNLIRQFSSLAQFEDAQIMQMDPNVFTIKFGFSVAQLAHLHLTAFAQRPATTFARDLDRKTALYVDRPIRQIIEINLGSSVGIIEQTEHSSTFNDNQFTVRTNASQQRVTFELSIPRQRVRSEEYSAFKQWCQKVEELESLTLKKSSVAQ